MFTQGDKKQSTNQHMGKYDPETAQAWALIMKRIHELRAEGHTLEAIGKLMHVGRAAVSRWISEDVGGERTTFGDMLRYAKALKVDLHELITFDSKDYEQVSNYDKALGAVLNDFAKDDDLTTSDLANKTHIPPSEIHAIFTGKKAITAHQLYTFCKVLEVKANIILNRAIKEMEKEQERNS